MFRDPRRLRRSVHPQSQFRLVVFSRWLPRNPISRTLWLARPPPGLTGSVSIGGSECTPQNPCTLDDSTTLTFEVKSQGVIAVGAGRLTIGSGPNPNPPTPTPAPTSAAATAGNGEATVTWQAPASQGSFPVSNYQVQSTPGSRGCVVPVMATSCRIGGLVNGRSYTFQVRALNGGGWGSWATTASVTPGPGPNPDASIMITGSRSGNDRVARVRGETTGLVGASVQSMVRTSDRVEFAAGSTRQGMHREPSSGSGESIRRPTSRCISQPASCGRTR
jgi:hypothetical protein